MTDAVDLDSINPMDWHDVRELDWIPRHFTRVPTTVSKTPDAVSWILDHTRGRFAFGAVIESAGDNLVVAKETVAFEDPAEATLFMLSYSPSPDLNLF